MKGTEDSQELLEPRLATAMAGPGNEDTSKNVEEEIPNVEMKKKVKGKNTRRKGVIEIPINPSMNMSSLSGQGRGQQEGPSWWQQAS